LVSLEELVLGIGGHICSTTQKLTLADCFALSDGLALSDEKDTRYAEVKELILSIWETLKN
jgi:hypothetical protein